MATFNNGESLASVRTKINDAIDKIDGNATISNDISVGGNITVTGTVDGRDVAADGATLDAVSTTYLPFSGGTLTGDLEITGTLTSDGLTVDGDGSFTGDFEISGLSPKIFLNETDTTDVNTRIRNASGNLQIQTVSDTDASPVTRFNIDHATGDISFYDTSGNASFVYDESAGSTFNEQGDNKDFRVESDSQSHMLFVDASANSVGINTSAPDSDYLLDVRGGSVSIGTIGVSGNYDLSMWPSVSSKSVFGLRNVDNYLAIMTGRPLSTEKLKIYSTGRVEFLGPVDGMTQLTLSDDGYVDLAIYSYGSTAGSSVVGYRADGTEASPTNTKQGQNLVGLQGRGYDGSNFAYTNAAFSVIASEDFTPTARGQSIYMDVVANGTTSGRRAITLSNGTDGVIFNDSGFGRDVRMEGLNETHAFFLDADTDRVSLRTTTPQGVFQIQNTSHDATVSSVEGSLIFNHLRGTYVDGEWHSPLEWAQPNSNGGTPSTIMAAQMNGSGSQKSFGMFARDSTGNVPERIAFELTETVINNDSANLDFRVEGGTLEHLLFVDAGANKVGINDDNPVTKFTVSSGGADGITIKEDEQDSTQSGRLFFETGTTGEHISIYARTNYFNFNTDATAGSSSGTTRLNIYGSNVGNSVVVNEIGADYDFRVESDNQSSMFFVDAGNDSIGLHGAQTSDYVLNIHPNSNKRFIRMYDSLSYASDSQFSVLTYGINDTAVDNTRVYEWRHRLQADNPSSPSVGHNYVIQSITRGGSFEDIVTFNGTQADGGVAVHHGMVVNDDSTSGGDFRVESDAVTHMLYVNAGDNVVSVDRSTVATEKFEVGGAICSTYQANNFTTGDYRMSMDLVSASHIGRIGTVEGAETPSGTSGQVQLMVNSSEVARVTADGITFGGDTAAANALDDYEEGEWTITCEHASVSNPSTVRSKLYTKVGRLVTVAIEFVVPTNSVSSQAIFGGLPVSSSGLNTYRDVGSAQGYSSDVYPYILNSTQVFYIYGANFVNRTFADLSNETLVVNLTYMSSS